MDLPNELIKIICDNEEFNIKDPKSIRPTNKLLCEFVTDKFGIDAFFDVSVTMSRPSLRAFMELSQHPRLGKHVRYVDVSPMFTSGNGSVTCGLEDMRRYMNRASGEKNLIESGDAETVLGIAFKAFAQREQPIRLAVNDEELNMVGGKTLLSNTHHRHRAPWISKWRKTAEITIRAVHDSGCRILELTIQDEGWRDNQYTSSFDTDAVASQLESVCSQLCLT